MKNIRLYDDHTQYEGDELEYPNVSYCIDEDEVYYNPTDPSLNIITYNALEQIPANAYSTLNFGDVNIVSYEFESSGISGAPGTGTIVCDGPITEIGYHAFFTAMLYEINLPKSVTSIDEGAFLSCTLQSITIPKNVTNIGDYAFYNIYGGFNTVKVEAEVPPTLGSYVFVVNETTSYSNLSIYVPDASVDAYKTSWSEYADIIKPMSEYSEEK